MMASSWLEFYVVADEKAVDAGENEVQPVPGAVELGLAERRAWANEIATIRLGETPFYSARHDTQIYVSFYRRSWLL
jgi:hypothetical protein